MNKGISNIAEARRQVVRRAVFGLGLLAVVAGFVACDGSSPGGAARVPFKSIDITGAEYARNFQLTDADGNPRSLADFKGKVLVVFFGYTQCPDVCPTTMAELSEVKRSLGPAGAKVQGVFVTVDPDRDTAALLKAYVNNFGPDIVGLRGSADEIRQVAKEFKVFYAKVPGKTETSYTVDHTAGSYVFDAKGHVRLFTRYGSGAQALADDLRRLLEEAV